MPSSELTTFLRTEEESWAHLTESRAKRKNLLAPGEFIECILIVHPGNENPRLFHMKPEDYFTPERMHEAGITARFVLTKIRMLSKGIPTMHDFLRTMSRKSILSRRNAGRETLKAIERMFAQSGLTLKDR